MYLVKGKITRPNTNAAFYLVSDELVSQTVKDHWVANYKNTGKCIHVEVITSPDNLEIETQQFWESNQAYQDFLSDPVLVTELFAIRDVYWNQNGVTAVVISEETI